MEERRRRLPFAKKFLPAVVPQAVHGQPARSPWERLDSVGALIPFFPMFVPKNFCRGFIRWYFPVFCGLGPFIQYVP